MSILKRYFSICVIIFIVVMLVTFTGCGQNAHDTTQGQTLDGNNFATENTQTLDDNTLNLMDDTTTSPVESTEQTTVPSAEEPTIASDPTKPDNNEGQNMEQKPTEGSTPDEGSDVDESTAPSIPDISETTAPVVDEVTYLEFLEEMSAEEQLAFINSFDSYDDFFAWKNSAYQAYIDSLPQFDGSTPISLGGNN